jgi:hypothetical protein
MVDEVKESNIFSEMLRKRAEMQKTPFEVLYPDGTKGSGLVHWIMLDVDEMRAIPNVDFGKLEETERIRAFTEFAKECGFRMTEKAFKTGTVPEKYQITREVWNNLFVQYPFQMDALLSMMLGIVDESKKNFSDGPMNPPTP